VPYRSKIISINQIIWISKIRKWNNRSLLIFQANRAKRNSSQTRMPIKMAAVIIMFGGRMITMDFKFMTGRTLARKSINIAALITHMDEAGALL
jgi:hypothetical protein